MHNHSWVEEFPGAITVCDRQGIIIEMNERAIKVFEKDGGAALIGANLLDCHPEPARTRLKELIDSKQANVYTIEKDGLKKLICQTPWYKEGQYCGFVEISLEIPFQTPHFIRK